MAMVAMAASPPKPQPQPQSQLTTALKTPLPGRTRKTIDKTPIANALATPTTTSKHQSKTDNNSNASLLVPPPLKFIDIDPNQRLPLPSPISDDPELVQRAEELVHWAISSKHENSVAIAAKFSSNKPIHNAFGPRKDVTPTSNNPSSIIKASQQHIQLTNLFNRKSSTSLLHAALHALISSNSGRELDRLVTHSKLHAHFIHLIMGLDPFVPPSVGESAGGSGINGGGGGGNVGMEKLRDLDRTRRERRNAASNAASPSPTLSKNKSRQSTVQIAESSIRHKETPKYITPTLPYFHYPIADAYLHLLVTLISNNSIFAPSAIRSVWNKLSEFGSRWMEWSQNEVEQSRKRRQKWRVKEQKESKRRLMVLEREEEQRQMRLLDTVQKKQREKEIEGEEEEDDCNVCEPKAKRRKIEPSQEQSVITQSPQSMESHQGPSTELAVKEKEEEEEVEPENERPVPGMNGLSVEFVRDAFYSSSENNDNEEMKNGDSNYFVEEIYSDRLASGRVQRLLLALMNIFRLCPRSKSDLLREISANFPHYKTCPPTLYKWYTHMCLQMVHLVPTFEGPILTLFVDKALDMDVEIKINQKGLVSLDSSGNDGDEGVGGGMAESSVSPANKKRTHHQISGDSASKATPKNKSNNNESIVNLPTIAAEVDNESHHIIEISERLDTLMTNLYQRILHVTSFSPDSLSQALGAVIRARGLYRHLDGVFDTKVRTTDRSKFVQFVFFVLFGRENDALETVGKLMAKREQEQQQKQLQSGLAKVHLDGKLDIAQTMKEMEMDDPTITIPSAPINVTDPLYRGFSAKLIDFFYNPSHAGDVVPRQTVVCYLASFVSRATYVCPETVCECVAALLRWAEVYISTHSKAGLLGSTKKAAQDGKSTSQNGNTQHACETHALFYTACQAAFYMMCFRGFEAIGYYRKALVQQQRQHKEEDGDDHNASSPYADVESVDIGPERWKFLCGHALQPLKYCLESVRCEFLHLAEDLDLFLEPSTSDNDGGDDDGMTKRKEANKNFLEHLWSTTATTKQLTPVKIKRSTAPKKRRRTIISTAATQEKKRLVGGVGGLGRGSNPLGSFFPFDPYLLQKSYEHVHPYYRNWEDCILTMEDDEDDKDDGDSIVCMDDDANHSEVSDVDDEEEVEEEESDDDDDEEEEDGDKQHSHGKFKPTTLIEKVASLQEDSHFEMEIRRSRAMSTGSQCSW